MKNIVIGLIFFFSGSASLGVSLWMMADARSGDGTSKAAAAPGSQPSSPGTVVAPSPEPAMPTVPDPVEPAMIEPAMVEPPVPAPTADATPTMEPVDAMAMEPATDLTEVLLVFDARSQHISKQVKEEITQLAKGQPDASFKLEVAAGEADSPEGNQKLGKKRARAIRKVLEDAGIPQRKVSYRILVPGPEDGDGEQTSRQWRKATVRLAGGGK
ncbi:OmpA family protein [Myxococcota bacterium]|nr:OmpA family protein [Myxococcota bacterium]